MKYLNLLLLCALMLSSCHAVKQKSEVSKEPIGRVLVINDSLLLNGGSDTLRLGKLHSGEEIDFSYNLKNVSSSNLVVLYHEITCGCIKLEYNNQPIKTNEHLPVRVKFDSRGLYGWQLKFFRLHLYGAERPLLIYVESEVE